MSDSSANSRRVPHYHPTLAEIWTDTIYSLLLHCTGGLRLSPLIPPALTERRYNKCEMVQLHAETGITRRTNWPHKFFDATVEE
jgi:hypothetical protein